jgi:hypothetical protein
MQVLKAYRSLSAEQKQILSSKQVDLNRPVEELLALLRPLATCDTLTDKARTPLGCTFGLGIVATVGVTILFSNLGWGWLGALVLAVVLAVMIGAGYLWMWTKRIDVSNNFRQFGLPVLAVFREDIDPTRPVRLHLDLSAPTASSKKQSESAPYKAGIYHKVIDTIYHDPWMSADAVLVDGSRLSWSVNDVIRERTKSKRTPRGKHKTKTKYSKKTQLDVELSLKKKLYDVTDAGDGELSSDDKRNTVSVSRELKSATLDPVEPAALIDLIAGVYRNARPMKKEAGA